MSIFERLSAWFVLFFLLLSLLFAFFFINREIHAAAFTIGERVQVSADSLNVYSKAGTSYSVRGVQPMGALGTVVGGPKSANGYTWWNINYGAGVDGWSTENNLKSVPSSFTSVIYEAEQLALVNYTVDSSLIKIKTGYTTGSATRNFTGATGTYNMQVYVSLENDGQSTLAVYKGSTLLKTYKYPLGSNGMIAGFSVGNVSLTGGDTILLVGNIDAGALARVDKIVFTSVSNSLTPPSSPTNLTGTAGNTTASLSWSASSGATSYTVKRSTTNGGPYTAVATGLTGTSHADTGLTNGTTYYYVVSAVNADGESANSAQASVTPFAMVENPVPVTYEAEAMTLSQYEIDPGYPQVIKVSSAYVSGNATQVFGGVTGTYDMQVYVLLENDGQSTLDVYRGSTLLQSYIYPLGTGNIASFTISKVSISNGETIRLFGQINAGAVARIDKIVLTPTSGVGEAPSVPANLTATAANGAAILR